MASALGKPARLLPIPAVLLSAAARLLGKRSLAQRLCGSLQVDIAKTRAVLGWKPPLSVEQALKLTASDYMENEKK
jgi:UDP-glucose 4-epimerase